MTRSSANIMQLVPGVFIHLGKSCTNIKNRVGLNVSPCNTPHCCMIVLESSFPLSTLIKLVFEISHMTLNTFPLIFSCVSLPWRIPLSTESNAFWKSMKAAYNFPLGFDTGSFISFTSWLIAFSQLLFLRKSGIMNRWKEYFKDLLNATKICPIVRDYFILFVWNLSTKLR